ncbi:NAD(+)/NADH kinase [Tindallia californiensis]|uniref:NAD kinase n=1 Tax=Tindallia californiensis TaxID=159292 RepID=A0A1H3IEN1_9FIRM|nr:NAD(+)/NADH kinase [Tindallia californiensis]SDY26186.1 NAD+ kinase [Tindallia californiensis]
MSTIKHICVLSNSLPLSRKTELLLQEKLDEYRFSWSKQLEVDTDLIICIGGDGSFLKTMHDLSFPTTPVVSVNTGHLGFFSEVTPDQIDLLLQKIHDNRYIIETINPLSAKVDLEKNIQALLAINEVVVKSSRCKPIHLKITVNNQLIQTFSGDGILVSTSTGSTAYSYSAGGSIVDPSLEVLQITPLAPINTNAYRCFTSSVIFPPNATIRIMPEREPESYVMISADGIEQPQTSFKEINISLSNQAIYMLRLNQHDFWNKVITKFL